jgi:hypothetical protein
MSIPMTLAFGYSFATSHAQSPDPVPRSTINQSHCVGPVRILSGIEGMGARMLVPK